MRVLVTGGAGYIGSHTTKRLSHAGFEPVILDNLSTGHRGAARWGTLVQGDLADADLLQAVLREYGIKAVIHFAALTHVGESVRDPRTYFRKNVVNALNLVDAMQDSGVEHLIVSSTCAIYGSPERVPIPEEHPQRPINPYGESKLFVERVLQSYGHAYGLHWVALRYFNAAGADSEGELGEEHDPETHLIPLAIEAALGQRPHIEIFGTDYPTPDGTAVRDYTHVMDLADAHVAALRYVLGGGDNVALNLGTGRGQSVREVIAAVETVSGRTVATRESPRRQGDPPVLVADASRAGDIIGWRPNYQDLEGIIETAWRWHIARTEAALSLRA